jgi:hypothetical protein
MLKKTNTVNVLEECRKIILNKISIKNVLINFFKVDQLSSMLLNESQLRDFKRDSKVSFNLGMIKRNIVMEDLEVSSGTKNFYDFVEIQKNKFKN